MRSLSDATIKKLYLYALNVPGPKTWWITRLAMYKELQDQLKEYDAPEKTCLAISDSADFGRNILGITQATYAVADYPEHNMLSLKFPDDAFDFCISDQVLEHVEGSPIQAFCESARIVRPGGCICHTTCFINEIHGVPKDFWRFTPDALLWMAKEAGLETVLVGSWGNREIGSVMQMGERFSRIPDDPQHPVYQLAMKNEKDWPIHVWIIARKPNS